MLLTLGRLVLRVVLIGIAWRRFWRLEVPFVMGRSHLEHDDVYVRDNEAEDHAQRRGIRAMSAHYTFDAWRGA